MLWYFTNLWFCKGVPGFSYAICRSSVLASCNVSVLTWRTRFLQNRLCCCSRLYAIQWMAFLCRTPTWTRQDSSGSPHQPTPCWPSRKLWRSTTPREGLKEEWLGASMMLSDPESPFSKVQSKPGCVENWDGQTWLQRTCARSSGESKHNLDNNLISPILAQLWHIWWLHTGRPYHHLLPLPQSPQLHLWSLLHNSGGTRLHPIFNHSWQIATSLRSSHLSGKSDRCIVFPNWQHWQPGGGRHGNPTYPHPGCPRWDGHTYSCVIVENWFICFSFLIYFGKYIKTF